MKRVAVLGAGKIGRMVGFMLGHSGSYEVHMVDGDGAAAESAAALARGKAVRVDLAREEQVQTAVAGAWAVVSCAPYHCNPAIAGCAKGAGAHYFDLTEDVGVTKRVIELAAGARTIFAPQCGLAPGFITIAATHLASQFSSVDSLRLRVGALPLQPSNALAYNLTWSTEGVINEYINDCEAVQDGQFVRVPALQHEERLIIDGVEFEAFNTSGGLGTLGESMRGKVRNLNYKTIRFPGHARMMRFLLQDLRMAEHREELQRILERAIPWTANDQVVVHVSATGTSNGRLTEAAYAKRICAQVIGDLPWTAIQVTTAAGVCAIVDLVAEGKGPRAGLARMEDFRFSDFIKNRFGAYYA